MADALAKERPELVVTLSWDESRWAIAREGSTLSGYGRDDWRGHVAHEGKATLVLDWSTMSGTEASREAFRGPMVKVELAEDEGTGPFQFVTPETKADRVRRAGGMVTWLTADEARGLACPRCERCGAPTFEWGGLTRHHGATRVRTDNEEGVACAKMG